MGFSYEWELLYEANTHISIWPWSDVVCLFNRYASQIKRGARVLEIGCGAGANIPFFDSMGVEYHALEGSKSIVNRLHDKFPKLRNNILVADFTEELPVRGKFDVILDRSSITHNDSRAIENCMKMIFDVMESKSLFIGVDWFSKSDSDSSLGEEVDLYTRRNIPQDDANRRSRANTGNVHFSSKEYMLRLFNKANLEILWLEHKLRKIEVPSLDYQLATWNVVAVKN